MEMFLKTPWLVTIKRFQNVCYHKEAKMSNYILCRFRACRIVVYTTSRNRAVKQLVKYIRETKGNLAYTEQEICQQAKFDTIDFVDDTNTVRRLSNLAIEIDQLKKEFNQKLDKKMKAVEDTQATLRTIFNEFRSDDMYDHDW